MAPPGYPKTTSTPYSSSSSTINLAPVILPDSVDMILPLNVHKDSGKATVKRNRIFKSSVLFQKNVVLDRFRNFKNE